MAAVIRGWPPIILYTTNAGGKVYQVGTFAAAFLLSNSVYDLFLSNVYRNIKSARLNPYRYLILCLDTASFRLVEENMDLVG